MAKDPAFLFYPGDYLRDTQTLSENSQVSYDRIMCEHMRNICITQQQLKFFTKRLNENEIEELMFVLTKIRGGFQIEWVAESIDKRKRYSKSRSENRRGKKEDMKNISKTYDEHMENENVIENKDEIETENEIEIYPAFIDFWDLYDKKSGSKWKCCKQWKKLSIDIKAKIIVHVAFYVRSTPDKQFRKNPETYLNQKHWENEILINDNGKTNDLEAAMLARKNIQI